ncbi:MAG: efflux RND transporter periplasmic adaptor subunit, partial [Cyclobacteriaceae bacterium]
MKNFLKINSALVIAVLLLVAGCTKEKATSESGGYYCPMHPTVESATVVVCPVCNMELVAKNSQGSGEPLTADERSATESPTQRIFAQVKTIRGTYSAHDHILKAEGIVNYDTRSIRTVTTRLSGRIETLHAAAGFTRVKKGQVLATIYSQEALEAQRNFIESSKDPGSVVVVSAQQRLTILGFSDELISKIKTGSILTTIPVVSRVDGYLLAGIPQAQPVREAERSMNSARQKTDMMSGSTSESKSITAGNTLRKGDFVSAGQDLFYLTEGHRVRLDLSIKESEFELLKPGQSIRGTTKNGDSFSGSIFLIEPDGSEQNAFRKARVYLNAFGLTIGSLVSVEISAGAEEGLWLPASSVLNLGTRSVVFLKNEDHFIPTAVITGAKVNDKVRIYKGLSSSDEVAAQATMLADSDRLIQSNDSPL